MKQTLYILPWPYFPDIVCIKSIKVCHYRLEQHFFDWVQVLYILWPSNPPDLFLLDQKCSCLIKWWSRNPQPASGSFAVSFVTACMHLFWPPSRYVTPALFPPLADVDTRPNYVVSCAENICLWFYLFHALRSQVYAIVSWGMRVIHTEHEQLWWFSTKITYSPHATVPSILGPHTKSSLVPFWSWKGPTTLEVVA